MKRRINAYMVLVAVLGIGATMALLATIFYGVFRRQIMADLRICALLLQEESPEELLLTGTDMREEGVRITLLDSQGKVLYDNRTDSVDMENHRLRPEVRQALEQGEGQDIRHSG